jgi:F0F1-type ATP synthase delta subunit
VDLKLPEALATKQDVVRVRRELQAFRDAAVQSVMRHDRTIKYPGISDNLRALAVNNHIDLHDDKDCQQLQNQLNELKNNMIVIHISFTADPETAILHKIVTWLRQEIDPKIVIQVGLQPSIAAGIIIRTPNRQFDFSLRQHLYKQKAKLIEAIK